jgi:hypothetical protein
MTRVRWLFTSCPNREKLVAVQRYSYKPGIHPLFNSLQFELIALKVLKSYQPIFFRNKYSPVSNYSYFPSLCSITYMRCGDSKKTFQKARAEFCFPYDWIDLASPETFETDPQYVPGTKVFDYDKLYYAAKLTTRPSDFGDFSINWYAESAGEI